MTVSPSPTAPPATDPHSTAFSGMACLDTSGNPRIPILMEMVGSLSRATDPQEVLREFARGFTKLYGRQGYVSLSTRGLAPGEYKITRLLADGNAADLGRDNPWRDWNKLPVHRGGFFGQLIRSAYPEVIHHFYLKDDPVVGDALAKFGSLMAIPLFDQGEPLNWSITLRDEPVGFSERELEETILRANLGGSAIRNVMMTKQLREANERIRREVDQIASIQRALLPQQMPNIPGATVSASYAVYDEAGGDYYDFFPLGCSQLQAAVPDGEPWDGPWGLLVADAAGHGPAAAVLMAMLHAILHAYPDVPSDPGMVLEHANEHLCRKRIQSSFVTAFFAIYDPKTRELTYANAGHPPPLVKNPGPGGEVRRLDSVGSIPLGVLHGIDYECATVTLQPGQTIVMYTDGVTESRSPDGEMFGVEGIEVSLERCTGQPDCVQSSVSEALLAHESGIRPSDDQTLVALRVNDEAE